MTAINIRIIKRITAIAAATTMTTASTILIIVMVIGALGAKTMTEQLALLGVNEKRIDIHQQTALLGFTNT